MPFSEDRLRAPYHSPIGWLKNIQPGFSLLGPMGNFLGKLPDVLQNAIALDIETSGIGERHAILEAAVYDLKNNRTIEYNLAPARVLREEGNKAKLKYTQSMEEFKKFAQPWTMERVTHEKGQFKYLEDYFSAVEKDESLLTTLKKQGHIDIKGKRYLSPEAFFRKFLEDIKGTKAIYAANLMFENRQLAPFIETLPADLQKELKEQFLSYSDTKPNILYRTADVQPYISGAYKARDARSWAAVGEAYFRESKIPGMRAGDIQDIARANMAEAKLGTFVKTGDFFTGSNVQALGQAYGLTKREAHTAAKDAILQGKLQSEKIVAANIHLRNLRKGGVGGFLTGLEGLITGRSLSSIQAAQRIEALQPTLKQQRVQQQLAHFELALRGEDVEDFIIKDQPGKSRFSQIVGGKRVWHEIDYPTGPGVRQIGRDRNIAVPRFLAVAEERLGLKGYGIDPTKEFQRISNLPTEELWRLYEPTRHIEDAERIAARNLRIMKGAPVWGRMALLRHMLLNYKPAMFTLGLIGGIAGLRLWNSISSSDDEYNTIPAMPEGGLAQRLRHTITDFGSGWQGLGKSLHNFFKNWKGSPMFITIEKGATATRIDRAISKYSEYTTGAPAATQEFAKKSIERMEKLQESGLEVVGLVRPPLRGTEREWQSFVGNTFHEFGHVLTLNRRLYLTPEANRGFYKGLNEGAKVLVNLRNQMLGPVSKPYKEQLLKMGGGKINPTHVAKITDTELAAESISHYLQRSSGVPARNINIARPYYPKEEMTPLQLLNTIDLGEAVLSHQTMLQRLANISGKDDVYNTIEGLRHEGLASALRKLFTDFGSGWRGILGKIGSIFSSSKKLNAVRKSLPSDIASATFFGSSRLAKALKETGLGASITGDVIGERLVNQPLRGRLKKEVTSLVHHIDKAHSMGIRNIPIVFNKKTQSISQMTSTAFHEYGHAVTLQGAGYSKEATSIYKKYLLSKDKGFKEFKNLMVKPVQSLKGNVSAEMMAESVSLFRQYIHGIKKPTLSEAYFSSKPSQEGIQSMFSFGRELSAGRIPAADDTYNTIEALTHGGFAEGSRRAIDVKFGSGWTRDINWTLPYEMSMSRDRLGPMYAKAAGDLTRDMMRTRFVPPGLWQANTSLNVYNASLPFSTAETRSNIWNHYDTSGLSYQMSGMSEQGLSAQYRSWNTGFGSGWKGSISTRDASVDFGGYRQPVRQPDYSGGVQYYNTEGYDFPPVEVPIQSVSPTRYMVDSISEEMSQATIRRRVKDYFRKAGMAEQQINTSMKMFMDSKTGSKRHSKGG